MNLRKIFSRETSRQETAKNDSALLAPEDVLSEQYMGGLHKTLDRIGVNVQRIEKL